MIIHHIINIPGEPEGCRRPRGRAIRTANGYSCRMHKHESDRSYQEHVQDVWMNGAPEHPAEKGVPVTVSIVAVHGLPKSISKRKR